MFNRTTIVSSNVLNILNQSKEPLSVIKIMTLLKKKGLIPNKTTIYRILKKLIEKKAIHEVNIRNGSTFYEIFNHHHHHFICNSCEKVYCLNDETINIDHLKMKNQIKYKKFTIESHDFNLYGTCEPCSNN